MRIRKADQNEDSRAQRLAKISDALAHTARIEMFQYIMKCNTARTPVRNKDLVAAFPYSQATVSQHLNKLVIGGLIEARQEGTSTMYYANIGALAQYTDLLRMMTIPE
ncbi:MAG: helix-turn-helix domain-containing protein [Clostridiales Family XIII bacterium]|jgi:ArsR family transcriptional regulator|nr:helix-turn-helix domain-containing protein [Clostridiales Family XIII bacterium]